MVILGSKIIIMADGVAIAACKSAKLSGDADTIETSGSGGQWKTFIAGRKSWSVSCKYLVTYKNFANVLALASAVTLKVKIKMPGDTHTFAGQWGGQVDNGRVVDPSGIYYQVTGNFFCAKLGDTYYRYWSYTGQGESDRFYTHPNTEDLYIDGNTGKNYAWDGEKLEELKALQGSAIVKSFDMSGAVGSIASGDFAFQGSGPLLSVTS